jgi:hypothetical protein
VADGRLRRISSQATFFYKRIFPLFWIGFIVLFVLTVFSTTRRSPLAFTPLLAMPFFMIIIGYVLFRKLLFDLVDEVWDNGDELIVKNAGVEERIALKNIINVGFSTMTNPERVTLTLREPSRFGKDVTFSPPRRFMPFARSPIVNELIERVDQARRAHDTA